MDTDIVFVFMVVIQLKLGILTGGHRVFLWGVLAPLLLISYRLCP